MDARTWRRAKELLADVADLPASEREAFLVAHCPDEALRAEVRAMLQERADLSGVIVMPSLTSGTRVGAYEILDVIGIGGMGQVYRARDTQLGREVAVKVLPPSFAFDPEHVIRFEREARLLASLNDPHIAHVYGVDSQDGTPALVMELVEGPTLADRIDRGPIPIREALSIAIQIAEALETAHVHSIVHRDLKPGNIKIREDGTVKVLDFGLARTLEPAAAGLAGAAAGPAITKTGMLLGTAAYMSPEQALGKPATERSDLWAFGVVLIEMLTGRRIFAGASVAQILDSVAHDEPDLRGLPPDTPPAVRRLLRRCLNKEPKQRLDSAAVARLEIQEALDPSTAALRTDERLSSSRGRPLRAMTYAAAATIACLVLVVWGARPSRSTVPTSTALDLVAPPGMLFDTLAVSPDGHSVAFTALDASGNLQLWLRSLSSDGAHRLGDADRAQFPFWSPDSRYVAYLSRGYLWKILVSGGPAQKVCQSTDWRGASWGANGTILFAPHSFGALESISAEGGGATPVTQLNSERGESSHRWPFFLPDGRHYVFTVRSSLPEVRGIYLSELGSERRTRLTGDLSNASYAASPDGKDGVLVFARGSSLVAQRLDVSAGRLNGDPIMVAEKVWAGTEWTFASFSTSSRVVAFQASGSPRDGQLAWLGRDGNRLNTVPPPSNTMKLSMSSDERRVLINSIEPTANAAMLSLLNVERGMRTRVTTDDTVRGGAILDPSGDRFAFMTPSGIFAENLDGTHRVLLYSDPTHWFNFHDTNLDDWSAPDGRFLVVTRKSGGGSALWALKVRGDSTSAPVLLTAGINDAENGTVSPDGRWLAYDSGVTGGGTSLNAAESVSGTQVYLQRFTLSNPGARQQVSTIPSVRPHWSSDSHELFFYSLERNKLFAATLGQSPTLTVHGVSPLFDLPYVLPRNDFVVAKYGQHFLVPMPVSPAATRATIILDWLHIK